MKRKLYTIFALVALFTFSGLIGQEMVIGGNMESADGWTVHEADPAPAPEGSREGSITTGPPQLFAARARRSFSGSQGFGEFPALPPSAIRRSGRGRGLPVDRGRLTARSRDRNARRGERFPGLLRNDQKRYRGNP